MFKINRVWSTSVVPVLKRYEKAVKKQDFDALKEALKELNDFVENGPTLEVKRDSALATSSSLPNFYARARHSTTISTPLASSLANGRRKLKNFHPF